MFDDSTYISISSVMILFHGYFAGSSDKGSEKLLNLSIGTFLVVLNILRAY